MSPVDEFVRSVQERFAENRATNWSKALLVLAVAVLWWLAAVGLRRRRARLERMRRIRAVLTGARLSGADDVDDLNRIAAAGQLPLIDILTVLAAFEHATAKLLEREAPALRPEPGSWYARVRHFRIALGFSPLSAHLWLLSTRELVVGDSIAGGGSSGHVVEVNEASFAVDWPIATALAEDAVTPLIIDRPDDARYQVHARLMKLGVPPGAEQPQRDRPALRRAFFAHDEQPERQQDRAHLRLRVTVAARLQIMDRFGKGAADPPPPAPKAVPAATIPATIGDISAGGLALHLPVPADGPIPRGARVRCWFALDGAAFDAVAAIVVGVGANPAGARPREQHLRLSFSALDPAERDRLASAVVRHQASAGPPVAQTRPR